MKSFSLIFLFVLIAAQLTGQNNDEVIKAALAGDLATVKKNIEGGADVNYLNGSGQTPLSVAYFSNEVTEYLLSKGADPNKGDYPALVSAPRFYSVDV
ncbi:MAG TPA: ankyrin repeat domain-containing protein, partial [Cyclobacteriaceae bacterium]|nr:ankyrin repeat domain-containing protein [Cyclobacteriaceae bacterium]